MVIAVTFPSGVYPALASVEELNLRAAKFEIYGSRKPRDSLRRVNARFRRSKGKRGTGEDISSIERSAQGGTLGTDKEVDILGEVL